MSDQKFLVPQRDQVSVTNQKIFDQMKESIGFVPNIYATYAYSDHALERYTSFAAGKSSLSKKEKEVINLVVSQVNDCRYCQAAHTAIGKMNGFSDEQILELRKGSASFDKKLDALARLSEEIISHRGQISDGVLEGFFNAGYDKGKLVDVIMVIGEKTITNFLHNVTDIPIDFPEAPRL